MCASNAERRTPNAPLMHEIAVATALLTSIEALARANGLVRVSSIALAIGVKRLVEAESLRLAFEIAGDGTIAAGARIDISEIPLAARCRACGKEYAPQLRDFRCPACQRAEPDILAGDDLLITSITGDDGKE